MSIKVLTGKDTRWSYANVWEPKADEKGNLHYSCVLLIPKTDTVTVNKIKAAIKQAYTEGEATLKGNGKTLISMTDKDFWNPLRDGDEDENKGEEYRNCYYVNAKNTRPPVIVNKNKEDILDHREVYSGAYGPASISFFAFNHKGNKGIGVGLNGLMKLRDGERFGNTLSADEMFDEDDDFLD